MITAIHHVQITIPRGAEAAAREFYCGVLGLAEIDKPDSLGGRGGFWLAVGDRSVHVGAEDGVDRAATKAHVAYEVTDLEDYRRRLAAAGVEAIESIPIPGHDRFELRDPFGNRVEVIRPHTPLIHPAAATIDVPTRIATARLDLRAPRSEYADEVNAAVVESIAELRPWMPWARATPTVAETRENLRRSDENWRLRRELRLLLFLKGTDTLVGSSGLHDLDWDTPRFEIGYWGRTRYCGHGYVTEAVRAIADLAFDALGARRVEIRTSGRNGRSIRVAERAGFPLEAVLRHDERELDGTLRDTHVYARVRADDDPRG